MNGIDNFTRIGLLIIVLGMFVVIIGALFKINHYTFGNIDGNFILTIGMLMEAFAILVVGMRLINGMKQK